MLQAILGAVLTTAAKDMTGKVDGTRISKTKLGANLAGGAAVWAMLPGALEGDALAIGQLVLWLIGWATTLYGRWQADQKD